MSLHSQIITEFILRWFCITNTTATMRFWPESTHSARSGLTSIIVVALLATGIAILKPLINYFALPVSQWRNHQGRYHPSYPLIKDSWVTLLTTVWRQRMACNKAWILYRVSCSKLLHHWVSSDNRFCHFFNFNLKFCNSRQTKPIDILSKVFTVLGGRALDKFNTTPSHLLVSVLA